MAERILQGACLENEVVSMDKVLKENEKHRVLPSLDVSKASKLLEINDQQIYS